MKNVEPKITDIFLKGFDLLEQDRYEDALSAFEASARERPNDAVVHYSLGLTYLLKGDRVAARKEYGILKNLDKDLSRKLIGFI